MKALEMLKADFEKNQLAQETLEGKWHGDTDQVGFITFGKHGAYLVVRDKEQELDDGKKHYKIQKVEPERDPPGKLYKGGAGDTSFAGFLLGHFNGLDDTLSAQVAMKLATAKLTHPEPRLPNAQETLREVMPAVADKIYGPRQSPRFTRSETVVGISA